MKEIKSKKTGRVQILTEEEYSKMVNSGFNMKRFIVTDLRARAVVPSLKTEVKKKKNEG